MSYKIELRSLDELASSLPFHIDEADRVNEVFIRYHAQRRPVDRRLLDLWTYCYVRRYFLIKFIRESAFRASELEQVVERTYRRVESGRLEIDNADRYAQWVSVVCRNTYFSFLSRRYPTTGLDRVDMPTEDGPEIDSHVEAGALHLALVGAIGRLPRHLQSPVRMRFIEHLSYEEISRITGKRVPTIRAYVHKACRRFRKDEGLHAWANKFLLE